MREELALYGGPKTAASPFPQWPQFCEQSLAEAAAPLRTGRVGYLGGTKGREFESAWAAWAGASHAVACASGTAALHLALAGLGIGPGDEVIVPSHTFISTALAVLQAGAVPVFCDVCDDHTLDPRALELLAGTRTKAVIVVHLFGVVAGMGRVLEAARRLGIAVIEDCAQCIGGEWKGRKAGTLGDAGCFSFSQTKHLSTAGEGGMVVTASTALAEACRSLCDYGRETLLEGREALLEGREPSAGGGAVQAHVRPGFNYRLTEIQAVVGLHELARLESWNLPRRRGFAKIYDHAFSNLYGVRALPYTSAERVNAYWKYPLQLEPDKLACGIGEFREALAAEGIPEWGAFLRESYEEPVFASRAGPGGAVPRCPTAEALRDRTVVLGLHPTWEKSHVETCVAGVKKVLRAFRR